MKSFLHFFFFMSLLSVFLSSTHQVSTVVVVIQQVQLPESEPVSQRDCIR